MGPPDTDDITANTSNASASSETPKETKKAKREREEKEREEREREEKAKEEAEKERKEEEEKQKAEEKAATPEPPPEKKPRKEYKKKSKEPKETTPSKTERDLTPCHILVGEMEACDDSWPFLYPVNAKQFPTYKKIIKRPMDIATIKRKLEAAQYATREEFCDDVRLIFANCEVFNEDDSPVGKAGHAMRHLFDTRWVELIGQEANDKGESKSATSASK